MREFKLEFTNTKPQVRFVGKGVILPDADDAQRSLRGGERARGARDGAAGLRAEHPAVPAGESARGSQELGRVGRVLWRKTIPLASPVPGKWTRYDLDVTELTAKHPGGLFQLTLSLAPEDALCDCPGGIRRPRRSKIPNLPARRTPTADDASNWDYCRGVLRRRRSTGTSATIPARRRTTATAATSAPRATCWRPTSA